MDMVKIGEFLKALRKSKGYTQQEVADALYVTQKTVSRWENGEGIPDVNILTSVADFYCITVDELLKGEKSNKEIFQSSIRYSNKNRVKLLSNKLLSKQNIYFIVALSICALFFMLGLILGLLVNNLAGLIIILFGLIIGLAAYIYGNYEIKKVIIDEDNIDLKEDLEKSKGKLKQKNILFSDVFFSICILYLVLIVIFYAI